MKFQSMAALLAAQFLARAFADPVVTRDSVLLGDQYFIRSQLIANNLPEGAESAASAHYADNMCLTCYLHWDSFQPRFAIASYFDKWATWSHDIDVDSIASEQAVDVGCGRGIDRNWIVWRGGLVSGTWARIFDDQGLALGPTFLVDNQYPLIGSGDGIRVLVNADTAVVILNTQSGDILMRAYTLEGAPLTDLIPIAAMPGVLQYERQLSVTSLPDGGFVIGYIRGQLSGSFYYPKLRRVFPDFTVGPEVAVSPNRADYPLSEPVYVRALDSGELLVAWREWPYQSAEYVQRYSFDLAPLGTPTSIDPGRENICAREDGRFLISGRSASSPTGMWARWYDENAQPLTERFDPLIPVREVQLYYSDGRPSYYGADGSIWLIWLGYTDQEEDTFLTSLRPYRPADMNYDQRVDNFDIDPFVLALTNPEAYASQYGIPADVGRIIGDVNFDGALNNFDIDPFVSLLIGG